jgi:hypothetical protein
MGPDYHSMLVTFIGFVVLPFSAVGAGWLIRKARARGRRLFRDEPMQRLDALRPHKGAEHAWDGWY